MQLCVNFVLLSRAGVRRSLADIIVATPGRLVDHINKKSGLKLDQLRFLVSIKDPGCVSFLHTFLLSRRSLMKPTV